MCVCYNIAPLLWSGLLKEKVEEKRSKMIKSLRHKTINIFKLRLLAANDHADFAPPQGTSLSFLLSRLNARISRALAVPHQPITAYVGSSLLSYLIYQITGVSRRRTMGLASYSRSHRGDWHVHQGL